MGSLLSLLPKPADPEPLEIHDVFHDVVCCSTVQESSSSGEETNAPARTLQWQRPALGGVP